MIEKYQLTAEEVLLIDLLFLASIEEGHKEYLVKYFTIPIVRSELRTLLTSLQNKGLTPDILYMSATPIPRTYALTLYGDMDVSSIKAMPKGRKDIITKMLSTLSEKGFTADYVRQSPHFPTDH